MKSFVVRVHPPHARDAPAVHVGDIAVVANGAAHAVHACVDPKLCACVVRARDFVHAHAPPMILLLPLLMSMPPMVLLPPC